MFSFSQSRFGGGEPWFRIGTFDVGTSGVVAIAVFVSLFVRAGEGISAPLTSWLTLDSGAVLRGQVWRMVTWWLANPIGFNTLIAVAIIFLLGTNLEGAIGRDRMLRYFAYLVIVPSVVAVLFRAAGLVSDGAWPVSASTLSTAIFLSFVIWLPNARGFFGIPIWIFGAAFVLIDLLSSIGSRGFVFLMFYVLTALCLPALLMRSLGLADQFFAFVPRIPLPGVTVGTAAPSSYGGGGSGPYGGDLYGGSRPASPKPKRGRFGRKKKSAAEASHLSVVGPASDDGFDALGIDAILDQVSELGIDSLTKDQKQRLDQYSKNRRRGN